MCKEINMIKKSIILLILITATCFSTARASEIIENYGIGSAGEEFYISYFPAQRSSVKDRDFVFVCLFSKIETEVHIYIPRLAGMVNDIDTTFTIAANTLVEHPVPMNVVTPGQKVVDRVPEEAAVHTGSALIVEAQDPIYCWSFLEGHTRCEGMLVIPKQSLGENYILSTPPDIRMENALSEINSNYAVAVALYDDTDVYVTLSDENLNIPGFEDKTITLQKGDVYVFGTSEINENLSGTKVEGDKPIAVYAGNCNAYIPKENPFASHYVIEQQVPVDSYGKEYYSFGFARQKNQPIDATLIAGENAITVNKRLNSTEAEDYYLQTAGGSLDVGFKYLSMYEDQTNAYFSSDKLFNMSIYEYSSPITAPFQLNLIPNKNFLTEHIIYLPTETDKYFEEFINIVFKSEDGETIPDDLQIGIFIDGVCNMIQINSMENVDLLPLDTNTKYMLAMVERIEGGVYKVTSNEPTATYAYGYGDTRAFGFPGETVYRSDKYAADKLPPIYEVLKRENFIESGTIQESDAASPKSGFNNALFLDHLSENCTFAFVGKPHEIGSTKEHKWEVRITDKDKPANATILFYDVAGNDTTYNFTFVPEDLVAPRHSAELEVDLDAEELVWSYKGFVIDMPSDTVIKSGVDLLTSTENATLDNFEYAFDTEVNSCFKDTIHFTLTILDYTKHASIIIPFTDCFGNIDSLKIVHEPDTLKPIIFTQALIAESSGLFINFMDTTNLMNNNYSLLKSITWVEDNAVNMKDVNLTEFKKNKYHDFDIEIYRKREDKDATTEFIVTDIFNNDTTFEFKIPKTVGILEENDVFSIYPNPVDNVMYIDFKTKIPECSIKISDIQGKTIYNEILFGKTHLPINTEAFAKGMYLIEVEYDDNKEAASFIKK